MWSSQKTTLSILQNDFICLIKVFFRVYFLINSLYIMIMRSQSDV